MKAVKNQADINQYIGGFCHDQASGKIFTSLFYSSPL